MRLLLIGPRAPPVGGATVLFEQLIDELSGEGDVSVVVVSTKRMQEGPLAALNTFRKILRDSAREIRSADVVGLHASAHGARVLGPAVLFLCRVLRKPCIFRAFGGGYHDLLERAGLFTRIALKSLLRFDRVLFETKEQVAYFERLAGSRVGWYPNSRPTIREFEESRDRIAARRFVFVGHVNESKGVRVLLEARQLLRQVPISIYCIGPLAADFAAEEFVRAGVEYLGEVNPRDIPPTLRDFDVLVLPTFYEGEGYPGVVLEAFSVGMPVIATRWRAIPELIDDACGILVPPKDPRSLARAIADLAISPEAYQSKCAGAKKRAGDFSSSKWTIAYVEMARALAAR